MELLNIITKQCTTKNNISTDAKIKHYKATMRNAVLPAAETITARRHGEEQLDKEEREIVRN